MTAAIPVLPAFPAIPAPARTSFPRVLSSTQHSPAVNVDTELVNAARTGDSQAFAALVRKYKSRIFATASRYARNHHELDDLAQDIFIRAWRGLKSFRGDAPFEHWLMRLAIRACYDFLRRHRNRREREVSRDALLEAGCLSIDAAEPVEFQEESEALLLLRRAMQKLSPKDQMVITLLELEERSVREVAGLTGWTETNVKVRAFRARQNLRKIIQRIRDASPSADPV